MIGLIFATKVDIFFEKCRIMPEKVFYFADSWT